MSDTRWFVLTPTPEQPSWETALAEAAAAAGLHLSLDRPTHGSPAPQLVLVEDAEQIPEAERPEAWGVMADPELAGGALAARFGTDEGTGWRQASRILASSAMILGARLVRTDAGADSIRCGTLTITPPPAGDRGTVPHHAFLTAFRRLPDDPHAIFRLGPEDILYNDAPNRPSVAGRIEMMGRPRIATFGPYLWVTPGHWRAAAEFEVDADGARQAYAFQWGDTEVVTERQFRPGRPGPYRLEIDVKLERLAPTELRIVKLEGALSGEMIFKSLEILRIG